MHWKLILYNFIHTYVVPLLQYLHILYVRMCNTLGHLGCMDSKYVFYTFLVENVSVYPFPQMTSHTRFVLSNQSTE